MSKRAEELSDNQETGCEEGIHVCACMCVHQGVADEALTNM